MENQVGSFRLMHFSATLPKHPGLNKTYRAGRGKFYMTAEAAQWKHDASLMLRAAGWKKLPVGDYSLTVAYHQYGLADIDAPAKALLDAIEDTLGVNDRHVAHLQATRTRTRTNPRIDVNVWVYPKNTRT
jgi:Holliday junction resolvase RusA-like endonuclease